MKSRILLCLLTALCLALASPAHAQRVSADLVGSVANESGAPVAGATIEIVHVPSGTTRFADTQENGRYSARGLRVGGPYRITVYNNGVEGEVRENVELTLGDPQVVNLLTGGGSATLDTLEVYGVAQSSTFQPDRMGTATEVTRDQIENGPSISRSINDYVRYDPRALVVDEARGEISVAGASNRFNSFTIDGVSTNDEFGLNSNGQPAVRGQPLSVEWLEQINIDTAPYDIKQSGFTGAGISAVTKTGSNEFDVRAYGQLRNEDMVGDDEDGNSFNQFDDNWYGAYVSGPILKDRLFFFVGYEEQDQTNATTAVLPASQSGVDEVIALSQSVYGFDPGNSTIIDELEQGDEKIIAKIDWNISDLHRASFRYSNVDATQTIVGRSNSDFDLSTRFYANESSLDQYSVQLFSDWSSTISTEFRASIMEYSAAPGFERRLPQVEIEDYSPGSSQDIRFGTENFRHLNELDTETTDIFFNLNWFTGNHSFDFGAGYKTDDIDNAFVFSNLGNWRFDSVADYVDGTMPDFYELRVATDPNNPDSVRAIWSFDTVSLWAQDLWSVTDNLTLNFGLRWEQFNTSDRPLYNPLFEDTFGFSNQGTLDGEDVWQPRFGFNYRFDTSFDMQLRGGVGIFVGRQPGVWLSNPFTNPGGTVQVYTCGGGDDCLNLDPNFRFTPDPDNQPQVGGVSGARQDVDVVQDGFVLPTDLKYNLALDIELPFWENAVFTAEYIGADVQDGISYRSLNFGAPTGTLPDGRLSYYSDPNDPDSDDRANADANFNDVLLLQNTGDGDRDSLTLALNKGWQFDSGSLMNATVSATWMDSRDTNSGTSSRAISNFDNLATVNPNDDVLSNSNFNIGENYKFIWSYYANWFDFGRTKFSAFWQYRSGRPYSWTFDNDVNGDNESDNDLLYVPRGPDDVIFADPAEEAAFFAFIESIPALASAKGTIMGRNTQNSPSINQLDLRVAQEFSIGNRFQGEVFFDIQNFLNLLDDSKGIIREVPFEYVAELVDFEGVDPATGKYIYSFDTDTELNDFYSVQDSIGESRWRAQIGVRLDF